MLAMTLPGKPATVERLADIRYVGQASELVVELPRGPYTAQSRAGLMQAFEKSYVAAFTRTPPTSLVELINIRVSASVETSDRTPLMAPAGSGTASAIKGTRAAYFPEFGDYRPATVFDRYALTGGQAFAGPAIVEERESTLVVGPGGRFEVHDSGTIIVSID